MTQKPAPKTSLFGVGKDLFILVKWLFAYLFIVLYGLLGVSLIFNDSGFLKRATRLYGASETEVVKALGRPSQILTREEFLERAQAGYPLGNEVRKFTAPGSKCLIYEIFFFKSVLLFFDSDGKCSRVHTFSS